MAVKKKTVLWGGPMDGKPIASTYTVVDWLAFRVAHPDGNEVTYNYMYNEDTSRFEFVGEDQDDE